MTKYHDVEAVRFKGDTMLLRVDGKNYKIDLRKHSRRLTGADLRIKKNYAVSPSGYGLHWRDVDEDLSIDALIGVNHKIPQSTF